MTAVKTYPSIIASRKFNSAQVLSKHPDKVLQGPGEFAGLEVSNGSAGQGTVLAAPHTPCRLLATAPALQADSFLLCATEFPCSWSFQLCCQAGTGCRQVSPPTPAAPCQPCQRGQAAPRHLLCPAAHCYPQDTDKLLVLLLFVPGLNLLRLPPAQGFTASPAWTAHMSS